MPSSARSSAISRADRPRRLERERVGQRRDDARPRIGAPFRRPQPRHPAAFLVDQHRRVGAPDRLAQLVDQGADLIAAGAIAPEQHKAERVGGGEKPRSSGLSRSPATPRMTATRPPVGRVSVLIGQ